MGVQVFSPRPGCSSMGERLFGEQEAAGPIPVIPTHGFEGSRNSRYCSMRYTTEELTAALKDADSLREVMTRLGIRINNGGYNLVRGLYGHLTPNTFDGMLEMRKHERTHQGEQ